MNPIHDNYSEVIIGTILLDFMCQETAGLDMAKLELTPIDFGNTRLRDIFTTILELNKRNVYITPEILEIEVPKITGNHYEGLLDELIRLRDMKSVMPESIRGYISGLKRENLEKQIYREKMSLGLLPVAEIEKEHAEKIRDLIIKRDVVDTKLWLKPSELITEFINECTEQKKKLIPTDFPMIDNTICPQAGDLFVIASRPGIGKTTLLTNIFINMLYKNIPCLFCPTETQPKQFLGKMAALLAGVPASSFRTNTFTPEQLQRLNDKKEVLAKADCGILNKSFPTLNEILKSAKEKGAQVIFIDYLGHCDMSQQNNESRARAIEKFVIELKLSLVDNNILCFLAVQLSREADKFPNTPPSLKDLADSSSVEKEADEVIFLWNNRKIFQDFDNPTREAIIRKNRWGCVKKYGLKIETYCLRMIEESLTYKGANDETNPDD